MGIAQKGGDMDSETRKDLSPNSELLTSEKRYGKVWCKPDLIELNIRGTRGGGLDVFETEQTSGPS